MMVKAFELKDGYKFLVGIQKENNLKDVIKETTF